VLSDPAKRLAEFDAEEDWLIDLAARMGGLDKVERKLSKLQAERTDLEGNAAALASNRQSDPEEIRARVEAKATGLRCTFEAAPTQARAGLMVLLAEERLRVLADEEQGFRVEGTLYVPLTRETPGERELHRASLACGSGGAIRPVAYGGASACREDAILFGRAR